MDKEKIEVDFRNLIKCASLSKATNDSGLKGGFYMLPWHAIPFLKGLGMLTPNPWENGWPHLWRSCNWQKNTQLNHSMAPKEPYRESEWADVSPLLKYISGAVAPRLKAPKGPYQASWIKLCHVMWNILHNIWFGQFEFWQKIIMIFSSPAARGGMHLLFNTN